MRCIMTPMPNHLSTRLTTHLLMSGGGVENTPGRAGEKKRGSVGKDRRKKKKNTPKKYIRTDQGRRTC